MKYWLDRPGNWWALVAALALWASPSAAQVPARNLQLMSHWNEYPPSAGSPFGAGYSACWSYIHGDGREYALLGVTTGLAIYNVTDPANSYRVAFIPAPYSAWHEMKSYRNWIYAANENGGTGTPAAGLQIIRMTDPEHPVLVNTYAVNFSSSHTVTVDTTRALLICNGTRVWDGQFANYQTGMRILSIANPESPVELAAWPGGSSVVDSMYVHDSVVAGNRLYASSVYAGTERVFDLTNPASPAQIAKWTYPQAFLTHNAWPDRTGNYLYVTDEQNGQTLRDFDISNLSAPRIVYEYTANPQSIVHNAFVKGDELYIAHYTEGIRVLDISDPVHPAEYGWADSYPGPSGGYAGVWSVCPFFPSGTVIASDMQSGLYVYRPIRFYGLVRAKVVDQATAQPLAGITVRVPTQMDSAKTAVDGMVQFAPDPGPHTFEVRAFGYDVASATRTVTVGSRDSVTLSLVLKPVATVSGVVRNALTHQALGDAQVDLAYTQVSARTDSTGTFTLASIPAGDYRVDVRRPGYAPQSVMRHFSPGLSAGEEFQLSPADTWDRLETDTGWQVGSPGDATPVNGAGWWTRVAPLGTRATSSTTVEGSVVARRDPRDLKSAATTAGARPVKTMSCGNCSDLISCAFSGCACGCIQRPVSGSAQGPVQPSADRSPRPDSLCFVTGQGIDSTRIDEADLDGGRTTLTSPALDLTGMTRPSIGFWKWFYSQFGSPDDWLATWISGDDGATWVAVDTTRGLHNAWEEQDIDVVRYVTPSSHVRVRFVAADLGAGSVVEAAIDDITTYDAALSATGAGPPPAVAMPAFRPPSPNPSSGEARLVLDLPRKSELTVEVLDLAGRRVATLFRGAAGPGAIPLRWNGQDEAGRPCAAGLYCARARGDGLSAETRIVRLR